MGALTSKTKEFTYRAWEQKSSIELDDTEVTLYKIRSEKLKSKRVRILPINYWISNQKRFSIEQPLTHNVSVNFKELRYFKLDSHLCETKLTSYLISNIKGYRKIINKFLNKDLNHIKCFTARKSSSRLHSIKIKIYDDLLLVRNNITRRSLDSFEKEIITKDIILLTNPRLDSPALNAYLFQNADSYNFTSFSTFASNLHKVEIPLCNYTIIASLQGYYDLNNKTVITSCLNTLSLPIKNLIILSPLYLTFSFSAYRKEHILPSLFILSLKNKKLFSKPVVQYHNNHESSIAIPLTHNLFDHFTLKTLNQKFIDRLLLLSYLIKPTLKYNILPIQYVKIKIIYN
jgi:hypothetical protein